MCGTKAGGPESKSSMIQQPVGSPETPGCNFWKGYSADLHSGLYDAFLLVLPLSLSERRSAARHPRSDVSVRTDRADETTTYKLCTHAD